MMLTHNNVYYASHGYGEAVVNYPLYFLIFWIANLVCGFAASVMLLFQIKQAAIAAFISGVSDLILIVCTALFRNRIEVLGINVFMFDLFILAITFGLYFYTKQIALKRKNNSDENIISKAIVADVMTKAMNVENSWQDPLIPWKIEVFY